MDVTLQRRTQNGKFFAERRRTERFSLIAGQLVGAGYKRIRKNRYGLGKF